MRSDSGHAAGPARGTLRASGAAPSLPAHLSDDDTVARERKCSVSFVQRYLQIGYNRAARIVERMEKEGVVTPANHVGKREILARDIDDRTR